MTTVRERRFATLEDIEIREDSDGGATSFRGHASVFNSVTDIGPFRERVAPGAFKRTIGGRADDVAFLYNHVPDSVMARTTNGSLRLSEDTRGLFTDADLDPSDWDVQRLIPKLRSKNVSQMSFGFRVVDDEWEDHPDDGGKPIRTLREVQLFDVSAVTFPAYKDTDASLRMAKNVLQVAETRGITCDHCVEDIAEIIRHNLENPETPPAEEREVERDEVAQDASETPADVPAEPPAPSRLVIARKRLEYLETTL
jgi:uncharacterized protein